MRRLWQYAQRHRGRWLWGVVLLLLTNATTMTVPQLFRLAVDGIEQGAPVAHLREIALVLVLIAVGGALFRSRSRIHIFYAARDVEMELRTDLYAHLTRQDAGFFAEHTTGDIMSRVTSDLGQARLMAGPGVLNIVNTVVAYGTAIPLMVAISPELTLITLTVYPPSLFLMRYLARLLYHKNRTQQEEMGALSAAVQENLAGAHVVRSFGLGEEQARRFGDQNRAYYDAAVILAFVRSSMWRLVVVIASIGILLSVYFGARAVLAAEISLGELVAFVEYMALLSWPTFALGWILSVWQRGRAAMTRISEILDHAPRIESGAERPDVIEPRIAVQGLSVAYGAREVLDNVDVNVAPGETLGVVGPVGSGKSTLVQALLRLIEVPEGAVAIGGHDIRTLALDSLRGALGYVPQNPMLFSMSLADNVRFGAPDAELEDVRKAVALAALDQDLGALPDGLDTPVGERGIMLSGGQKQRTAIARALLMDAPILVLDDALSSVDAETEDAILTGLRQYRRGRTTVIVAHRVTAVAHADEIIVLDAGRIVERGTHGELVAAGGLYSQMARRQELERGLGVVERERVGA